MFGSVFLYIIHASTYILQVVSPALVAAGCCTSQCTRRRDRLLHVYTAVMLQLSTQRDVACCSECLLYVLLYCCCCACSLTV